MSNRDDPGMIYFPQQSQTSPVSAQRSEILEFGEFLDS